MGVFIESYMDLFMPVMPIISAGRRRCLWKEESRSISLQLSQALSCHPSSSILLGAQLGAWLSPTPHIKGSRTCSVLGARGIVRVCACVCTG